MIIYSNISFPVPFVALYTLTILANKAFKMMHLLSHKLGSCFEYLQPNQYVTSIREKKKEKKKGNRRIFTI